MLVSVVPLCLELSAETSVSCGVRIGYGGTKWVRAVRGCFVADAH